MELELAQHRGSRGLGGAASENLMVRGELPLWVVQSRSCSCCGPGAEVGNAAVGIGLGRGNIQSFILTVGYLRAFRGSLPRTLLDVQVGLQRVSRAADWDPSLTCLYKLCVGVNHRHPLASSPLPHLQNQTLGNPPFCWDHWVSMFYSEVHSKYFH